MSILSSIKKALFNKKEIEYFYFKRTINKYYGLCGCERQYTKYPIEKGQFSQMWNSKAISIQKNQGFILTTKSEYEKGMAK